NQKNERGAALSWHATGAQYIDRVELEVAINKAKHQDALPLQDGTVELLRIEAPTLARVMFGYTRGGGVEASPYTGYVLTVESIQNASIARFKVEPALTDEQWVRVKLVANM